MLFVFVLIFMLLIVFTTTTTTTTTANIIIQQQQQQQQQEEEEAVIITSPLSLLQSSSLSLPISRRQQKETNNTTGEFAALNERWSNQNVVIEFNDERFTLTKKIAFQPLTVSLYNISCSNLAIDDITWIWRRQTNDQNQSNNQATDRNNSNNNADRQIIISSDMNIINLSIDCNFNYEWDYTTFEDNGEASVSATDGNIETTFILTLPPSASTSSTTTNSDDNNTNDDNNNNQHKSQKSETATESSDDDDYHLNINNCDVQITISDFRFINRSPVNIVLNAMESLFRGFFETKIEETICSMLYQVENNITSLFNNITSNNNDTDDNNNLLSYEETIKESLPKDIQLINFQENPNPTSPTTPSSIVTLINQLSQFIGIDIFVYNTNNNTSGNETTKISSDDEDENKKNTFLSSLFNLTEEGEYIIDLSNNEVLYSFDDDDSSSNTTTNNNISSLLTDVFGIIKIRLMNATIIGLNDNTISTIINNIQPIGNYTIGIGMNLQEIQVQVVLEVDRLSIVPTTTTSDEITNNKDNGSRMTASSTTPAATTYAQAVQFQLNVSNLNFEAGVLLAIDEDILGSITLGSLLRSIDTVPQCLSSALYDKIQITGVHILPLSIHSIIIDGLETTGMERIITTAVEYGSAALQNALDDIITKMVSGIDISTLLLGDTSTTAEKTTNANQPDDETTSYSCPAPVQGTNNIYVDMRDLLLPPQEALLYGGSGTEPYGNLTSGIRSQLRSIVSDYTNLTITQEVFNYTKILQIGKKKKKEEALVQFLLSDFRFQNKALDNQQGVLDPVNGEPYVINNTFDLENALLGGTIGFGLEVDKKSNVSFVVDVTMDIGSFNIILTLLTKILEDNFLTFPVQDAGNLNCWLALFQEPIVDDLGIRTNESAFGLSILDFDIQLQDLVLNVTCIECSQSLEKATQLISSRDYTNSLTLLLADVIEILFSHQPSFVQILFDRLVMNSPQLCPHHPKYNASAIQPTFYGILIDAVKAPETFTVDSKTDNKDSTTLGLLISVIIIGFLIVLGTVLVRRLVKAVVGRNFHKMIATLPAEEVLALIAAQEEEDKEQIELDRYSGSLFTNKEVPVITRFYIVPGLLLVSTVFLWLGLFSPSMAVMMFVYLFGEKAFQVTNVSYSLAMLANNWWKNGAYSSAILAALGFLWPQMKVVATLALWYLPTTKVSVSTRGSALKWLDILGKWSILSVFMITITASIFQGEISTNIYTIKFIYVPTFGVYAIILGHILSVAASKTSIHYHNDIINNFKRACDTKRRMRNGNMTSLTLDNISGNELETSYIDEPLSRRCAMRNLSFIPPHGGDSKILKFRTYVQYGFTIICGLIIISIIVGCVLPSFEYDISGLVGLILNYGESPDQTSKENSVFTIVSALMESTKVLGEAKYSFGLGLICTFLIVTLLIIPVFDTVTLLVQWQYPMEQRSQIRLKQCSEHLEAFQCMEVYFAAALSIALGLNGISDFFAKTYCASLTEVFRTLVFLGLLEEADAECIVVNSSLRVSTLVFFFATVVLVLLRGFIKDALNHRIKQENNRLRVLRNIGENAEEVKEHDDELKKKIDQLRPTSDHFTDRFHCVLCNG